MKTRALLINFVVACAVLVAPLAAQEATPLAGGSGPSNVDTQGRMSSLLGPRDTLDMRVFGLPEMNWTGEVDDEGNITLPFIDTPIKAMCRNEREVQKDIVLGYSKFLKNPQISLRVTSRGRSRPPATVLGAVKVPSRVEMLRSNVRLNELLAVSGGLTERANGSIQIFHTDKPLCPTPEELEDPIWDENGAVIVKIYKFADMFEGKPDSNPIIRPGDVVTFMEADPIYFLGGVNLAQPLLLREGLRLSEALALAGGITQDAKNEIRIHRATKAGKPLSANERTVIKVDYKALRANKTEDIVLQPFDIIEVPLKSRWAPDIFLRDMLGGVVSIFPRSNLPNVAPRVIR